MIGEILRNAAFAVSAGETITATIPIAAGLKSLGIRFDGNTSNPDCTVEINCEFSPDSGVIWRPIGSVTINAQGAAVDLPNFPGSAYTLMGTHDGTAGEGRLRIVCPQAATFAVYTDF